MKKATLSLLFFFSLSMTEAIAQDQMDNYANAYADYKKESQDYISIMRTTRSEVRTWRSIFLRERFESRLNKFEKSLLDSNKQILDEVEKAVKAGGLDSLDDVLLMRMAQLYFERENLSMNQRMKAYEYQLRSFLEGRQKEAPQLPVPNYKKSIDFAKTLLTKYPRSPLSDKAHYLMAFGLDEMGQYDAAIDIYKRFIRRHPFSPLSDEIRWRLAEHHFDSGDLNQAAFFYTQLSEKPKSTYRLKALYKLGASYFAGKRYEKSAQYFLSIYDETSKSIDDNRENETLLEESLEYLGIILSYGVNVAMDSDVRAAANIKLAEAYKRVQDEKRNRDVYFAFLKADAYSKWVPSFTDEIILSYLRQAAFDQSDLVRDRLVGFLTKDNNWWNQNRKNHKQSFIGEDLLEEYLLASAQSHAIKGYESKNSAELKVSRDQYNRFIRSYPDSHLILKAKFEVAQVEYTLGLYTASKETYKQVMSSPQNEVYIDDASYGYLLSVIRLIQFPMDKDSNVEVKRGASGEVLPVQELTERDKAFLSASQVYIENVATGARRQKVLYKVAEVHFQNNNFDLSEQAIQMILADTSSVTETTAKALRLSAEIANVKGNWELVAQRNQQIMNLSFSTDLKSLGDLQTATPGTQALETANKLEASGQKEAAAVEFERIAIGLPNTSFAPYAAYKAAMLYRDERKFKESLVNCTKLKGTTYEAEGAFLSGANKKSLLSFQAAADEFEQFSNKYPKHPWVPDALFNSASIRRDLKQYEASANLFMKYFDAKGVDTVLFESIELFLKASNFAKAKSISDRFAKNNTDAQIRWRVAVAEAYWKKSDVKQVVSLCREIGGLTKSTKKLSAHGQRARAVCRYFSASSQIASDIKKAEPGLEELMSLGQKDLVARLHTDLAVQYDKDKRSQEASANLEKAWDYASRNPFSAEGEKAYSAYLKINNSYPVNAAVLLPWRLEVPSYLTWVTPPVQQMSWGAARSLCEREEYIGCLKEIDLILKTEGSDEMLFNKFIAELRAGYEIRAKKSLESWAAKQNWNEIAVRVAILLGWGDLVPAGKKNVVLPEQGLRYEALIARAEINLENKKYKEALADLQDAILENAYNSAAYVSMARLFLETGHNELVREVLKEATKNTNNRSGLLGLYYILESVTTRGTGMSLVYEKTDQLDSRALFGLGLATHLKEDTKTSTGVQTILENKGVWGTTLSQMVNVLSKDSRVSNENNSQDLLMKAVVSSSLGDLNKAIEAGVFKTKYIEDMKAKTK